jgi:hypothetical protein
MVGLEALGANLQAVGLVGVVLGEAIALYVGYGALERLVGDRVTDLLRGQ